MPTLGNFIHNLAIQAGIDENNEQLKAVLNTLQTSEVTVPDELVYGINKGLLTVDAARNNDTLKDHYYALFAKGGEAHLRRVAEELGWDQQTLDSVMSEKTLMAKYGKLVEKIRATENAGKKPSKEIEEQLAALNNELVSVREKMKEAVENERNSWISKLQNQAIESVLTSFDYGIDVPKDIAVETAKALINRKLSEAKYKVGYDPDNNSISLLTDAGLSAYENNAPVVFKNFANKVLADNKLLKVVAPAPAGNTATQTQKTGWTPTQVQASPANGKPAPAGMDALIAMQQDALKAFND